MPGKLIASSGRTSKCQHETPCSDCPWRRDSLPGWLGEAKPEEFVMLGHNDQNVPCHVITNQQCAGLAIYRTNVVKRIDPPNLRLPADRETVFASPFEFLNHHLPRHPAMPQWLVYGMLAELLIDQWLAGDMEDEALAAGEAAYLDFAEGEDDMYVWRRDYG